MFFSNSTYIFSDVNPVTGSYVPVVEYFLLTFSTLAIGLRLWSRGYYLRNLGWDDACALLSWIFALLLTVSNLIMIHFGYGHHEINITPANRPIILYHVWLYQWAAATSTGFSKASICFFYLRFVKDRVPRLCVICTLIYILLWSVSMIAIWMCRCYPIRAFWYMASPIAGSCMSTETFIKITGIQAGFGASTHFLLIVLPISTIWKLQMPTWKRLWFLLVLWLGGTCCLFAIGRISYTIRGIKKQDMTWYGYNALLWQALEVYSQVFYICIPFIKPVAQGTIISSMKLFGSQGSRSPSVCSEVYRRPSGSRKPSWPFDGSVRELIEPVSYPNKVYTSVERVRPRSIDYSPSVNSSSLFTCANNSDSLAPKGLTPRKHF